MSKTILIGLFFGIALSFIQAYITYNKVFQQTVYFYPAGIFITTISGFIWYYISKNTIEKTTFVVSMIWDSALIISFILMPVLYFGVDLSKKEALGVIFIVVGTLILKI